MTTTKCCQNSTWRTSNDVARMLQGQRCWSQIVLRPRTFCRCRWRNAMCLGMQELDYLVQHTLRHVQLPYFLDDDEKKAFDQAISEVVFLLGRSGSGKTSVLVHSLFRTACQERQRRADGGEDDDAFLMLLVTRSPVLADSIRKLFAQMQAGPAGGSTADETNTLEDLAGIELGVVKEEERRQFRPPPQSLQEDVFDPAESPVITSWESLLLMLDRSIEGEPFFRPQTDSGSRVTRALQRRGQRSGGSMTLRGQDRFENEKEEGRFDMEWDHLSYEEFEEKCGPKLWGAGCLDKKEDSLFGAYREFLTVIAGSPRAARSAAGCLSKEEYVTGKGPDGKSLPEIKDSSYKNSELGRQRVYGAFEVYKKFKQELHRYDCTDVARDLLKRAQAAQRLKDGGKKIRKFFGVYVDEVQDLLPVELLLLKLVSDRNEGFIFAGDTAQTISKGVEFRFESIRRLYYEEFCGGKQHESEVVNVKVETCSICQTELRNGGSHYVCMGKYHEYFICKNGCEEKLEEKSRKLRYGATPGLRKKLDSAGAGKINCPFGQETGNPCGLMLTKSKVGAVSFEEEPSSSQRELPQQLAQIPDITCLSQNHRSTNSILELAAAILDLITHFFPDKIDKLPREKSRVKSSTPPRILNKMSWEEAQKIIFANDSSERAVLEFGAKQVVLVWSEEKKREMKEKLTQSLVMTIHECKGLEFFDVLLVDPFSDMSGCTNESQAQQNWNLIFGVFEKFGLQVCTNEKKRAPAFVDDKHGLLCAWLKTLYVGITRARKRVWILESQEHGQSLVRFLQEMGVAQICNVGDDLAGSQGFAATSTSQEWFDMGLQMFRESGNYEQAKVAFGNAEKANFIQATPWKLLAEAEECRKPARMDHSQAGAAYVRLAEWLENALGSSQRQVQDAAKEVGVEEKNLRPSEARQRAAEGFMEAMDWSQASREFEKAGCFSDAAECADALQNWKHAGKLWRMAGEDERALKRFHRAEAWNDFVEVAEQVPVDGKLSAEVKVELITHACREMANHLKKNGRRKQDKESKSTLICCIRLLPEEDREVFLETLQWQELTMQVYEADKRYEKCAAISLEIRDWKKARQQGQANQ
ncbi:unnamed protein product [Durusdinium trenchii]|uniref:UvrD-like helicase ATP-binding domain-containing protein n=1 Tax=Durusdinium trenchii TaxID=1381693 RepID=A0ABP0JR35_9DINO